MTENNAGSPAVLTPVVREWFAAGTGWEFDGKTLTAMMRSYPDLQQLALDLGFSPGVDEDVIQTEFDDEGMFATACVHAGMVRFVYRMNAVESLPWYTHFRDRCAIQYQTIGYDYLVSLREKTGWAFTVEPKMKSADDGPYVMARLWCGLMCYEAEIPHRDMHLYRPPLTKR